MRRRYLQVRTQQLTAVEVRDVYTPSPAVPPVCVCVYQIECGAQKSEFLGPKD